MTSPAPEVGAGTTYVVGGYTDGPGQGLGLVTVSDGQLGTVRLVVEADNPSYVVVSPDSRVVYAVLEREQGAVGAWLVGDLGASAGTWEPLGEQQPTGGSAPCHLALSHDGRHLLVANYGSGSVTVFPVLFDGSLGATTDLVRHTGTWGPNPERQEGPHAHQVVVGPTGLVFACDLGLDTVFTYALSADGRLTEVARAAFTPGSGPRHLAFSPDGRAAWVVCELSSTIVTCDVDGPTLTPRGSMSTRPPHLRSENLAAAVLVDPEGVRVLVSNRGDDSVAVFDVEDHALRRETFVATCAHWPRDITWGPAGEMLVAAERSDAIVLLTGPVGRPHVVRWPSPTCLAPLP